MGKPKQKTNHPCQTTAGMGRSPAQLPHTAPPYAIFPRLRLATHPVVQLTLHLPAAAPVCVPEQPAALSPEARFPEVRRSGLGKKFSRHCSSRPVLSGSSMPLFLLATKRDRKSTRLNSSHSQISYA